MGNCRRFSILYLNIHTNRNRRCRGIIFGPYIWNWCFIVPTTLICVIWHLITNFSSFVIHSKFKFKKQLTHVPICVFVIFFLSASFGFQNGKLKISRYFVIRVLPPPAWERLKRLEGLTMGMAIRKNLVHFWFQVFTFWKFQPAEQAPWMAGVPSW